MTHFDIGFHKHFLNENSALRSWKVENLKLLHFLRNLFEVQQYLDH